MALRQNWYLISCKWLRLTAGQSKKYWVFTKQGHARSYQRITKDMTKLEKIKSPKICLESCSCKITGATTISCVFFGLFLVVSDSTKIKHRRGDPPWEGWKPPRPVPAQPFHRVVEAEKKNDGKTGEVLGVFFVNPQVVVVNRVFSQNHDFLCFCAVKKKRHSNIQHFLSPIPPKTNTSSELVKTVALVFFEWNLGILQMRKMDS